ncbi:G-protein coupled receptor moody-like [Macrobrachium nipponense]|uniref:G-protein coupled receptor moody-like n=1 Tax=Macrobrachium nipponense TaxID=159736 RepID=UPI0030C7A423
MATDLYGYSHVLLGFMAFFVFLIGLVGTVGNLLAAMALLYCPKLRQRSATLFMVNLPACLIPVCALGMPMFGAACIQRIYYGRVMLPEWVCVMTFVIGLILSQVHIHTICALAFNRLIAVLIPAWYKRLMTPTTIKVYLIGLWVYSILLWLPLACKLGGSLRYIPEEMMVSLDEKSASKALKGLHVFLTYILPILFTSICYLIMYIKVRVIRKVTRTRRASVVAMTESNIIRQWDDHVTKTILVIYLILITCSVPHLVIHVLQLYTRHQTAWLLLHAVFWLQFCLDPIVYVIFSRVYRRATWECLANLFPNVGMFQVTEELGKSEEKSNLKVNNLISSPGCNKHLRPPPQKIEFSSEVHRDLLDPKNIAKS